MKLVSNNNCFGFNGMLRDDDVKEKYSTIDRTEGTGNSYDFGARIYDPRVGRFLSLDPMIQKYPGVSPYNFVENNPILRIDAGGKEWRIKSAEVKNGVLCIQITVSAQLIKTKTEESIDFKDFAENLKKQIDETYTADFTITAEEQAVLKKDFNMDIPNKVSVTTVTTITVVNEVPPRNSTTDHLLIIDKKINGEYVTLKPTDKAAAGFLGLNIFFSENTAKRISEGKDEISGSHEFVHTGGLWHPDDYAAASMYPSQFFNYKDRILNKNTELNVMYTASGKDAKMSTDDQETKYKYINTPQFILLIHNIMTPNTVNQKIPKSTPVAPSKFD